MTNSTLERAARALAVFRGWDESYADEHDAERYHRENGPVAYVDETRAVLMAVKDPDTEIVDEGLKQWSNLRDMFDVMIDAILAEGE